jgi:Domain of unknown function (DUF4124)
VVTSPALNPRATLGSLRSIRDCVALALGVLCAGCAHATVFKCVDPGGAVSYQQRPCPAAVADGGANAALVPASQLAIGMRGDEVKRLRGPPDSISHPGSDDSAHTEEWLYSNSQHPEDAVRITLQHGVVVRWNILGPDTAAVRR